MVRRQLELVLVLAHELPQMLLLLLSQVLERVVRVVAALR